MEKLSPHVYWNRALLAFDSGAAWMRNRSLTAFVLVLSLLLVIRSGLYFMPATNLDAPNGLDAMSWSDASAGLWLVILKAVSVDSRVMYEILSLIALVLSVVTITWLVHRNQRSVERWVLIVALVGSLGTVLTGYGRSDTFLIVGAVIFAVGGLRSPTYVVAGALLIVIGNRMQSVVMAIALLVLALIPEFRSWFKPGLVLLAVGVAGTAIDSILAAGTDRATQIDLFGGYLLTSLESSLQNAPLLLYALFGVGWIPVIGAALMLGSWRAALALAALVAIPTAAMFTTLDGMRVGVGVSAVPFLVVVIWFFREATPAMSPLIRDRALFLFLLIAALTPGMHVGTQGVTEPWDYLWFSLNFWSDVLTM